MSHEPVVIPGIILSDHVVREEGTRKLTLIGTFATWNAPGFPFMAPPFFLTALLSNFRTQNGIIDITVHIETSSRHTVWSASAKINFQTASTIMPPDSVIEIPFRAIGVQYPEAGRYFVRIFVDSDEIGHRSFLVQAITSAGIQPKQ